MASVDLIVRPGPLRVPTPAALASVARAARRPFKRPSLRSLIHRTNFYWTPDARRLLLEQIRAAVAAGRPRAALALAAIEDAHGAEAHAAAMIVAARCADQAERDGAAKRADAAIHALHVAGKECVERANPAVAVSLLFRAACALPFVMRQNSRAPGVILCDLATALQDMNDFVLAATFYREALDACPAEDPKYWLQRSVVLSNFGVMRMVEGRFDEASTLFFESVAFLRRSGQGPGSGLVATLINAAHSEQTRGNLGSAERFLRDAIRVARKAGETASPNYMRALLHAADSDLDAGRGAATLRKSRQVQRAARNFSPRLEAEGHSMEGECHLREGRYAAARSSLQRAYDLLESRPSDDADERVEVRQLLADVERREANFERAEHLLDEAAELGRQFGEEWIGHAETLKVLGRIAWDRGDVARCLSLREQAASLLRARLPAEHPKRLLLEGELAEALARSGKRTRALRLLEGCIRKEGLLLARLVDRRNTLLELGRVRVTRNQLELYIILCMSPRTRSAARLDMLLNAILAFRGLAASLWKAATSASGRAKPSSKSAIGSESGLLAVTETYRIGARRLRLFLARSQQAVTVVEFGDAALLEAALRRWTYEDDPSEVPAEVREFANRFVDLAKGAMTLVWLPDHMLSMHPVGALPLKDGRALADAFAIAQPRDAYVLNRQPRPPSPLPTHPLIVGISRFGSDGGLNPLPWVEEEISIVARLIDHEAPVVLAEGQATFASVLSELSRRPRVVHIATHGLVSRSGATTRGVRTRIARATSIDPLAGTALVLGEGALDMIPSSLSARDIIGLDLVGVQLVVVSACDSGVAPSDASEGVLGLQAAFHAAGAEVVLTSLWPLYDEPTAYLIGKFYSAISSGTSTVEALRSAQISTRTKWPRKSHWGGWVVSGPL